ncbi:MAG: cadherin-like domain-containing protein, partial [Pseudomonadota bacterium]
DQFQILVGAGNQDPVAQNDAFGVLENGLLAGNVLADNGGGADFDPDEDPLTVDQVNGSAASVGQQIVLGSGALLTLGADGTFDYDPNGAFEALAQDGPNGNDGFSYRIADGQGGFATANVTITVTGENDPPFVAMPLADQGAVVGELFNFMVPAGTFDDVDTGDLLILSATQADGSALPAWLTFDPEVNSFTGTPGAEDEATLTLRVTATDPSQASVFDDFELTVVPLAGGIFDATWTGGNGLFSSAMWSFDPTGTNAVFPNNDGVDFFNAFIDGGNGALSTVTLDIDATLDRLSIDNNDSLSFSGDHSLTVAQDAARPGSGVIGIAGSLNLIFPGANLQAEQLDIGHANLANLGVFNGTASANTVRLGIDPGTTGSMSVSGLQSQFNATGTNNGINVGLAGNGFFDINNGASVSALFLGVGDAAGSFGSVSVTGINSLLTLQGAFAPPFGPFGATADIGVDGTGSVTVSDGGEVQVIGQAGSQFPGVNLGANAGGNGILSVTGPGSSFTISDPFGGIPVLILGGAGTGTLVVTAEAEFLIEGPGAEVSVGQNSSVVPSQQSGSLAVISGGSFTVNGMGGAARLAIGDQSADARGVVSVDGTDGPSTISVMGDTSRLEVGNFGDGTLLVTTGGVASSDQIYIAIDPGSVGFVNVTGQGSLLNAGSFLGIGVQTSQATNGGTATVFIDSGGEIAAPTVRIGTSARLAGDSQVTGSVTSFGTIEPGFVVGTLTIVGDYLQDVGGTLDVEVAGNEADLLMVDGSATLVDGAIIDVSVFAVPPVPGDYTILETTGGIIGNAANLVVVDDDPDDAFTYSVQIVGMSLVLTVATTMSQPPVISTNTGVSVSTGGTADITFMELEASDLDNDPFELTFNLIDLPDFGSLELGTGLEGDPPPVILGLGESFTQEDIFSNALRYIHDGGDSQADSFGFVLDDSTGNILPPETFVVTVGGSGQTLPGTPEPDLLAGGDGDDTLLGFASSDILDGGAGFDTADYSGDAAQGGANGVTVNLSTGIATDGFGDMDALISIEAVVGTQFIDTLIGDANDNRLSGESGDDILDGGAGDDRLTGGLGVDVIDGGADIDTAEFVNRVRADLQASDAVTRVDEASTIETLNTMTGAVVTTPFPDTLFLDGFGVNANGILYSVEGGSDQVFEINLGTTTITALGSVGAGGSVSDVDFLANGMMLGVTGRNVGSELWSIDPSTGAGTFIGDTGLSGGLSGLAINSTDQVYASTVDGIPRISTLVQLNPATAAVIGAPIPILDGMGNQLVIGDLAFQPGTDVLFGVLGGSNRSSLEPSPTELYTIDVTTGLATLVGPITDGVEDRTFSGGLGFGPDGTLIHGGFYAILETDLLISIENVSGTDLNDILIGDINDNILDAFGGVDRLESGGGSDSLFGGGGTDFFVFSSATIGTGLPRIEDPEINEIIRVDGADFSGNVIDGDGSTVGPGEVQLAVNGGISTLFLGLDAVAGSDGAFELVGNFLAADFALSGSQITIINNWNQDEGFVPNVGAKDSEHPVVQGDDKDNSLQGSDGDDVLIGGGGMDTLVGGAGADKFFFLTPEDGATVGQNQPVSVSGASGDIIADFQISQGDTIGINGEAFGVTDLTAANFATIEGEYDGTNSQGEAYGNGDPAFLADGQGNLIYDQNGAAEGYTIVANVGEASLSEESIQIA